MSKLEALNQKTCWRASRGQSHLWLEIWEDTQPTNYLRMEAKINAPGSTDHPGWLKRKAAILRRCAEKREKGRNHKLRQK
jgi:hypothetical protein